jgi:protein gp37
VQKKEKDLVLPILSPFLRAQDVDRFLYFLLGQFMTGQRAQFSLSSFSMPKGIISPHRQTQPSEVFVCSCSSQKGQASIVVSFLLQCYSTMRAARYDICHMPMRGME